ncbi:Acetolactate synthase [Burkholderiales bacterium 8X]|nr:Acetolactate synthase [Burkholderiales bacterium 8X]
MPEKKGAEIIIDHLVERGVPYLFGLCGHGDVALMDAALDRQDRIKTISTHHEQTAGFMADAYFRVSGQPVATFTSCGPGSVSIQAAIACAMADSSAIFAITGNVPTQQFNKGPFQELGHHYQADFVSAMRPYVKRSYQASRPDMLPDMMRQAYSTMLTGRVGPVHLDVPFNVFAETTDAPDDAQPDWSGQVALRSQGAPEAIERAVDLLHSSTRPLILAGHGCTLAKAGALLTELAELLDMPVATTPQGKGAMDERHPLCLGPTGRDGVYPGNRAARSCDVLLALGTRFGDRGTSGWIPGATHSIPPTRLIHVDHDAGQIGKNYPATLGIVGDVTLVLEQLLGAVKGRKAARPANTGAWRDSIENWRHEWQKALAATSSSDAVPIHPDRVINELQKAIPEDAVMLADIGAHHSWMVQQWKVPAKGRLLQSGAFASMGLGVAGALGAKLARPESPVVAVVGDGGFMMHSNVVATAVEYELPIVWVVWNNCGYVSIRDIQTGFFGQGREFATRFRRQSTGELQWTDYAMLAEAMGARGVRVERPGDLAGQLSAALASGKPTVLDVRVQSEVGRLTSGAWDMPPLKGKGPNFDPDPHRG